MQTAKDKGRQIERLAKTFLEKKRLKTIRCNYLTRGGEIDLIMRDRDTLVFVEVRYRKNTLWGSALETVDIYKQKKIISTAEMFLSEHPHQGPIRFDVLTYEGQNPNPQWTRSAFDAN